MRGELLYGRNGVTEALLGRRTPHKLYLADGVREDDRIRGIISSAERAGIAIDRVPRQTLDDATGGVNHQSVALDASGFRYADLDDAAAMDGTILVLDHLQDPQNVGTLLRAAEASGAAAVIIPTDRAAAITPAVVNASSGAVEHVPVVAVPNLARVVDTLKSAGRWAIALEDTADAVDLFSGDLPIPAVLVIGAEGPGIGPNLLRYCDVVARIPMRGRVASLNAATAGSIALFELVRRQGIASK